MASTQEVAFNVNLVKNSTAEDGGWAPVGSRSTVLSVLNDEDNGSTPYILVAGRADEKDGMRQAIQDAALKPRVTYRVTGWIGLQGGSSSCAAVRISLRVEDGSSDDEECNWVECAEAAVSAVGWTEINGTFRLKTEPRAAAVYVHGAPAGVDVKVMDLRVSATDRQARFRELQDKTNKARKRGVVLKLGGAAGAAASIRVVQMDNAFPFGSCINGTVVQNRAFVDFFSNHFSWAVFENELKWYHTEPQQGQVSYADADALLDFCERHGKRVRGHCVFWAVESNVQQWVKNLGRDDLQPAVKARLEGLVSRYAGRFGHYDVNNEMLHGRFFRDRLGEGAPAIMFREVARIDPAVQLFVNDYNVECGDDPNATPEKYIELISELQRGGAQVGGIGLQGHVTRPVGEVVSNALDKLAAKGIPIWFTELDVSEPDVGLRAADLEVMLREAFAHPAVHGIVLWGFMQGQMWRQDAYLVNADGTVNEAGQMFLNLQREWKTDVRGNVDGDGSFTFRGFHGTYVAQIVTEAGEVQLKAFTVEKGDTTLVLDLDV